MILAGKVALITGGGSGIGRATAFAMAGEGAKVMIADINENNVESTVEDIKNSGGHADFYIADVTKENSVANLVEATVKKFSKLQIAFNSAGLVAPIAEINEQDTKTFEDTINADFYGVYLSMKYEIPAILNSGGGAIVNASSTWGLRAYPGRSAYIAAKHAVCGITKTAALEFATKGIRINSVAPGPIRTPLLLKDWKDKVDEAAAAVPMGRVGEAKEVADAVVWLCSEKSSFITGHDLPIDGGMLARVG